MSLCFSKQLEETRKAAIEKALEPLEDSIKELNHLKNLYNTEKDTQRKETIIKQIKELEKVLDIISEEWLLESTKEDIDKRKANLEKYMSDPKNVRIDEDGNKRAVIPRPPKDPWF